VTFSRRPVDLDKVQTVVSRPTDGEDRRAGRVRVTVVVALRQRLAPQSEADCLTIAVPDHVVRRSEITAVVPAFVWRVDFAGDRRLENVEVRKPTDPADVQV